VRVAACPPNNWASFWQIWPGAHEPAKVARARRVIGNKEARDLRLQLCRLLGFRQHGR
jgi:hypothetical protein